MGLYHKGYPRLPGDADHRQHHETPQTVQVDEVKAATCRGRQHLPSQIAWQMRQPERPQCSRPPGQPPCIKVNHTHAVHVALKRARLNFAVFVQEICAVDCHLVTTAHQFSTRLMDNLDRPPPGSSWIEAQRDHQNLHTSNAAPKAGQPVPKGGPSPRQPCIDPSCAGLRVKCRIPSQPTSLPAVPSLSTAWVCSRVPPMRG